MNWAGKPGDCLLVPSGPGGKQHLFTVTLGPCHFAGHAQPPHVLLLSVTSIRQGVPPDDACLLQPGEHPFITRPSYIYYREPRIEPVSHVQNMIAQVVWQPKPPCSPQLLARIVAGLHKSKRMPRHILNLLSS